MRSAYKFNIGNNENISSLCKISNNLYNQALYIFRETLSKEDKWLSYFELDSIMKNTKNLDGDINYRLLKAQCSQQVLRILDKNIKSYYKSVQDYKKNTNKYKGKPGLPNYKKRGSEFNLYYTSQSCKIKDGKIILSKDLSIPIPQYEKYSDLIKDFKQIRIKPLSCGYKIEIIYEVKDAEVSKGREEKIASIDLGIDNFVTLVSEDFTYLFSGNFVKSYNQRFNKTLAKLNSIKDLQKIKGTTKRIKKLYYDRCGGRKMYINIEGKGIVTSNNCRCQGDVSDAFKDLMPDNATWATKEEFDKAPVVGHIIEGIGLVFTDRGGHEVNA